MSDFYSNMYNPDVLTCLANLSNDEVFTPPEIANRMLDMLPEELWHDSSATFLDPACKSGVFLREIAKRLIEGLEEEIPDLQERIDHIFHKQLYGIAITELTSLLSRRSVYCSKYPNSRYSLTQFEDTSGNIRYKRIKHRWQNGKCTFCGASKSEYERGDELETHAYEWIHTIRPEEIFKMKFDVIIGNPPYQLNNGGGSGSGATPIYHNFVLQAKKLSPRYLCMITPSRWFAGGSGMGSFRKEMLTDGHIRKIVDYPDASDCFAGINLNGGVSYFLWDKTHKGDCEFTHISNGKESTAVRDLNEFDIFIRYNEAVSIIHKVMKKTHNTMENMVSPQTPFGFLTSFRGRSNKAINDLTIHSSKGISYVSRNEVSRNIEWIDKYKVLIGKALSGHAGELDNNGQAKIIAATKIIGPKEVCTQTYLVVGPSDTEMEAKSIHSYLCTKFVRFLMMPTMVSISISGNSFRFVPKQIFDKIWTDRELYAMYELADDEIEFIESMIKPMEIGGDDNGN